MPRTKPFVAPKVTVAEVSAGDGFDTVTIAGSLSPYTPPLAPAGLYDVRTEREEAAQLHKITSSDSDVHTFHTYRPQRISASIVGGQFVYRSWWTPQQFQLVTDTSLRWERAQYAADEEHVHCALTWEAITAPMEAYHSDDTWITVEAYEQFIRDDILHSREA